MIDSAEIRNAVLKGGMTHRAAAAHFKVSLRQVQKAVNPLKRVMQDRSYYARNRKRYKQWAADYYKRTPLHGAAWAGWLSGRCAGHIPTHIRNAQPRQDRESCAL